MLIRVETEIDQESVRAVNTAAFATLVEGDLVDALRKLAQPFISMVAEKRGEIIAHIAFSPASLLGHPDVKVMGLGPMAVLPDHQRQGIGSALVNAGLERCTELGCDLVVVLGHPEYYPRFGFSPATRFGIDSEYDVPAEVFMALELQPDALGGRTGTVQYHAAFSDL